MRGPGTELSLRRDIADKCRSCGNCRAVCPIFAEIGREDSVARGKVALIRAVLDGELGLTEIFDERIQLCLNCKACIDACPNDVRVDDLILSARSGLVEADDHPERPTGADRWSTSHREPVDGIDHLVHGA